MHISTNGQQGRTVVVRLKPGDKVIESVNKILEENKIKAGYIPVIQGGFKNLRLISMTHGKNEDEPERVELTYREPLEYFGTGTIGEAGGKPSIHVHLSAAQAGNKSLTGHLVAGEVVLLTEIVIVEITGVKMIRKEDPEVYNFPLLYFE